MGSPALSALAAARLARVLCKRGQPQAARQLAVAAAEHLAAAPAGAAGTALCAVEQELALCDCEMGAGDPERAWQHQRAADDNLVGAGIQPGLPHAVALRAASQLAAASCALAAGRLKEALREAEQALGTLAGCHASAMAWHVRAQAALLLATHSVEPGAPPVCAGQVHLWGSGADPARAAAGAEDGASEAMEGSCTREDPEPAATRGGARRGRGRGRSTAPARSGAGGRSSTRVAPEAAAAEGHGSAGGQAESLGRLQPLWRAYALSSELPDVHR
jgi:hypothetical protein